MTLTDRGAIYNEQAYSQGKMLDHSGWQRGEKIVRLITPSDIDVVWDNNGHVLFAEFSSSTANWAEIKKGQRWLYESVIREGPHCAVLCRHNVPTSRQIRTKEDVDSFSPMFWDHGLVCGEVQVGNETWLQFVKWWFRDPIKLRRSFLGRNVGMVRL